MALALSTPVFDHQGEIPATYTCDGADVSPQLQWSGIPEQARSLVLIVDDPDAPDPAHPRMTWVHWLIYNLPPDSKGLPEGMSPEQIPQGSLNGINDWKREGYGGPCPPVGRHRYFFKLYALDTVLDDLHGPGKAQLEAVMQGHIIESTELVGTYQH